MTTVKEDIEVLLKYLESEKLKSDKEIAHLQEKIDGIKEAIRLKEEQLKDLPKEDPEAVSVETMFFPVKVFRDRLGAIVKFEIETKNLK